MIQNYLNNCSLVRYIALASAGFALGVFVTYNLSINNSKLSSDKKNIEEPREYCPSSGEGCVTTNQT
uniref:VKc domain-containing protein n=1 Tax=Strongyloides stercoralis TaxID=6248 RepID=A0A0K0DYF8_STRER